jgi:hypothetical protein
MIYDAQFFIDKFDAIPEEKWTTGFFELNGAHCANGHCGVTDSNYKSNIKEADALVALLRTLEITTLTDYDGFGIFEITANINDGFTSEYQQETPKQRILAALYDIKKLQTKDTDTGGKKERIVYVSVPVSITEQARELIGN